MKSVGKNLKQGRQTVVDFCQRGGNDLGEEPLISELHAAPECTQTDSITNMHTALSLSGCNPLEDVGSKNARRLVKFTSAAGQLHDEHYPVTSEWIEQKKWVAAGLLLLLFQKLF